MKKTSKRIGCTVSALILACNAYADRNILGEQEDRDAERQRPCTGLKIDPYMDTGIARSSLEQPIPEDWQSRYQPGRPDTLDRGNSFFMDFGLRVEPYFKTETYQLGLPIFGSLNLLSGDVNGPFLGGSRKTVAQTTTEWWGDTVYVTDISLTRTTPGVGVCLQRGDWNFQVAFQGYKLERRDFRGADNLGGPNGSGVVNTEEVDSGVSTRFDIGYRFKNNDDVPDVRLGVFYERIGGDTSCIGLNLSTDLRGFRSQK